MKVFFCKDMEEDCAYMAGGDTIEEVAKKAEEHAKSVHGLAPEDLTPELRADIRSVIKDQ